MNVTKPVIYVITCGASAADGIYEFIAHLHAADWRACVIATPMGAQFVDVERLRATTGHPVRTEYKTPDAPDILPPADLFVVAPATFNTVNKIANGISDTLAVGLLCEGLGSEKPVIMVPWMNRALASHGAYRRSLALLREEGVQFVLTNRTNPEAAATEDHEKFPWGELLEAVSRVRSLLTEFA